MTDFKTYYTLKFREDINKFFQSIPDESKFHEDVQQKRILSIQNGKLNPSNGHLDFLIEPDKEKFGVALFFSVLVDEVCYSHFKQHYNRFQSLTLYPKFIGNCPGACHYHLHPSDIFFSMNSTRTNDNHKTNFKSINFSESFIEAVPVMEAETKSFFNEYLQDIDGQIFWELCTREFPFKIEKKVTEEG